MKKEQEKKEKRPVGHPIVKNRRSHVYSLSMTEDEHQLLIELSIKTGKEMGMILREGIALYDKMLNGEL